MGFIEGKASDWYKARLMWDLLQEKHPVGIKPV